MIVFMYFAKNLEKIQIKRAHRECTNLNVHFYLTNILRL
jgi:hypothetical protein